ncbi:hypothetical protein ACIRN4_06175 [Pimelobacter simplex]|uniref:hypothetical protein n=1 Tax=Nocardioides simplex TaxID=2045 RepID=UPI0037F5FF08
MGTTETFRQRVAAEVRAEMARQKKTGVELAEVLRCSQQSASRRVVNGKGLDLDDLPLIADWLGISVVDLVAPRQRQDVA